MSQHQQHNIGHMKGVFVGFIMAEAKKISESRNLENIILFGMIYPLKATLTRQMTYWC